MKISQKLKRLSKADNGTPAERGLKLCEEVGEVAEAILTYTGRKNSNKKKIKLYNHVVEELVDTIVMCQDLLTLFNFTDEAKIEKFVDKKLNKWQRKVKKKK